MLSSSVPSSQPVTGSAARVLVVEDEHLVALDIQLRLERMGHVAIVAYSGEEALERAAATDFDLVLMDIKLRGLLDGIDTAKAIHRSQDVPVIYLTAYADAHTVERARITEPYGYILKPFQERELKAAIEMALQRHEGDRRRSEQQELHRFLADATTRLAESLDYRTVATDAAHLLVPRYGDWCSIQLKETEDSIPPFTYTQPNGAREPPTNGHDAHAIEMVLRSVQPVIFSEIADVDSLSHALGLQHVDELLAIGAKSLVCVPLLARHQVIGALALVAGQSRAPYTAADLLFAEDFAHRLGMALDNALLYRKAERAIRMRDDVLAIVSHDLRTPLGSVLMQAQILGEQPALRNVSDTIVRSVRRMNRLIADLLDASSVNAGQLALDCAYHPVDEVVLEAAEMFRSQADAHAIHLYEELPAEPVQIYCDRDRMVQVLSNLIGNSIKFTPRGGSIVVAATQTTDGVRFEVRDTGSGIAPENVERLFDRFWRGQAKSDGGAGLGLFIARGIVDAHGSVLTVETALGQGSRFYFTLPAAQP